MGELNVSELELKKGCELLAEDFNLNALECRLLVSMASGLSLVEVAEELELPLEATRLQVLEIMQKMHVEHMVALVLAVYQRIESLSGGSESTPLINSRSL